jgi:hypothetical protein
LNRESSLSAENLVSRAPRLRTQNSPSRRRVRERPTANRLQFVPSASK